MKKMGRKFIIGSAMTITAISSAALMAGCYNPAPSVYGPPSDYTTSTPELNPTVYGPPEDTTSETTTAEPPVYGPPAEYETSFEVSTEINEDVYGPPEDFETSTEINVGVYGPPDDFNPGIPADTEGSN